MLSAVEGCHAERSRSIDILGDGLVSFYKMTDELKKIFYKNTHVSGEQIFPDMNKFKFEKLEVWKLAMELAEALVKEIRGFPDFEKYNLSSQMLRAVDSIALNIAEGSIGQTNPEFKRFLSYAIRSTAETVTCLIKAFNRGYLHTERYQEYYDQCYLIINKLIALRRSIYS